MHWNDLTLFVGRNRWLKRPLLKLNLVPESGFIDFKDGEIRRLYLNPTDLHGPSYHVMFGGYQSYLNYEKAEKDVILNSLPDNGVFLDIGANIGLFSLYTAVRKPEAKIYAFEPHLQTYQFLNLSLTHNKLKNIRLIPKALGEAEAKMDLIVNKSNAGGHTFVKEILEENEVLEGEEKVVVTTLDNFVESENIKKIDVIKIDVQGFEKSVLLGARKTLKKHQPVILMECDHPQILNDRYLEEILEPAGYFFRPLHGKHLQPLKEFKAFAAQELARGKTQTNIIFMH